MCLESLVNLCVRWFDTIFKNLERHGWEATFFATVSSLWLVRNNMVFNEVVPGEDEVVDLIKTQVELWIVKFDLRVYSVDDFKIFIDGIRKVKL